MRRVLGPDFFNRPRLVVARELIGKFLVRRIEGNSSKGLKARTIALMITETEAYGGFVDLASHSRRGKTARNAPMFGQAGTIYVYFTYGMHWMLNLVCGKAEYPAAVLIRAIQPPPPNLQGLTLRLDGPAKLTKYLAIDKALSGRMLGRKTGLWVEDRGVVVRSRDIARTPRIGIDYAGEYVHKLWRFVLLER